jgi:hypothetical protein
MNLREIEAQAKALAPVIKRFVQRLLDPLDLRIKALEARQPEKGEPGPAGKDVDPNQVERVLIDLFHSNAKALAASVLEGLPIPKDGKDGAPGIDGKAGADGAAGKDGVDGKSVTVDEVLPVLQAELKSLVAAIPAAANGVNGKDGAPGRDGTDGKSVTVDEVLPVLQAELKSLVAAIPAAANGVNGKDGAPGRDGTDGKSVSADEVLPVLRVELKELVAALPLPKDGANGKDGAPGRDGVDGKSLTAEETQQLLATVNEATFAKWALDFERRAMDMMERAIDRIPKPANGKDGRDGFGFEDVVVEHDGGGLVTVRFVRGEETKEFSIRLPVFIDRGVFREEVKDYMQGNGVTFGGSFYIAQKDSPQGKPGISSDWRLAVKKGRDGRGES